jgi:ClpP class serine protease
MNPGCPRPAQRLFNVPLATTSDKLELVMCALADRFDLAGVSITVTFITYGEHAVDANDVQPAADDARARIQADVDETCGFFVTPVARSQGIAPA